MDTTNLKKGDKMAFKLFWRNGLEYIELDTINIELTKLSIEKVAIEKAISLYANVISKCEFRYFNPKGEELIKESYPINIRPNINQSATVFWREAIKKMFKSEGALIFQGRQDKMFYLADEYKRQKNLYFPDRFTEIKSREIGITESYDMSEVIFLETDQEYKSLIDSHYKKLGSIVDYVMENYRLSNGRKLGLRLPNNFGRVGIGNETSEESLKNKAQDYVDKIVKKLFTTFNAVIPLQADEKFEEIINATGLSVSEIQSAINTIFETVSIGFNIPIDIFFGKTTEKSNALNDWITLGLGVLIEQITDELNAKEVGQDEYGKGYRMTIDTTKIKHRDLLDSAGDIDKLHANGFTLNEILRLFGLPPDKKDVNADKRFFTKNQDISSNMKGGE